ncbi:response regulator transcription factor [Kocuria sp. cx-455]|uniref:response regulator transcription factor n=1 Tax=unclassified Candidatus Sulfotelmatobacter TaxID=2635724 RepID=UPI0016889254|nr:MULTISPECIES: response regulator transcription factor [unclassified Candidatus Sulfotelmatobacter]MBD2762082.1 response regulator transcription factor [Kocuria sp. cx-116]MBD2763682.1 response regulator transcription factor [Kocuria sp. cx-455]
MRLLIVDDEVDLSESLRRGLINEGFVVDVANDGVTGAWLAHENPYDVIVLDLMLPGKNGYTILKEIRAAKNWTPVLMLTAKDGEYDETDAFDLGADDYLTKPFSFMVLVARLRALMRRGAPERPVNITVGSLELDPSRHKVTRGDTVIELTAKEYVILQYLMQNADTVVSKLQIMDNAWDAAFEGSENIVEVYVGYLRKKIDVPFGLNTLQTVRGMGYRLVADTPAP